MGKTVTRLDRDEVVSVARELVLREGPAALTMRRLATELDVGTPTIYWHVGSRDELVAAVIDAQAERLAKRPIEGLAARDRVLSAALHIYGGAVEERAITSLAHQTGTSARLLARLEDALVAELEAAGLHGAVLGDAVRSILVVVTGSLVLTLRDYATRPDDRDDALWSGCDLEALTTDTLRAVVDRHVPPRKRSRS
ncbi:MAG TPA: TetR family transcriptional regulator [Acidimicrobiales bacterium]|jgi:AcrR family transcriptional regulator|nr:TetR family transcriptional regulator [Acidimicrobiales bacterium]